MNCNGKIFGSILVQLWFIMHSVIGHHQRAPHPAYSFGASIYSTSNQNPSTNTAIKPQVWEKEQQILNMYQSTTAQVGQTSTKINEINHQILTTSLDIVATNVMRFDQYIDSVDSKTKDCKYNSETQIQRVKDLLNAKLKTKITHCMTRVNNKIGTYEKSIQDELNKYNNVILQQIKTILLHCNKMHEEVMIFCLDKSMQISVYVSDKFLSSVNGYFSHALIAYNQSNTTLMECLQRDLQANKKHFHWAIKLFRTAACKHVLNT
uniref:Uncharacterized protein n=1 Tax=Cacopsylla melanoneura TaxID=428564 RepID=A0A8D9ANV4_9HEMI